MSLVCNWGLCMGSLVCSHPKPLSCQGLANTRLSAKLLNVVEQESPRQKTEGPTITSVEGC